ncbi:MAG: CHAT domain-containing tetratricopeptide repeat protein [Bacteroidales bacterium]|nr:CHAT domain-containing tetratricopeptide repeat protein [Bacteroidales bacterium]
MQKITVLTAAWLLSLSVSAQATFRDLVRDANEARAAGHYQRALPLYQQAAAHMEKQRPSQQVNVLNGMAACLTELGEYDQALNCYNRLEPLYRQDGKDNPVLMLNRTSLMLLTGQYAPVVGLLRDITCDTEKEEAVRLSNLAFAYDGLKQTEEGLALIDRVLAMTGDSSGELRTTALNNRGFMLWKLNRRNEACAALREAVNTLPADQADHWRSQSNLAVAESSMPLIDECLAWFRSQYGTTHPDYALCLRKKAEIMLRQQQTSAALPLLKEYFSLRRQYILHHFLTMGTQQRLNFWAADRDLLNLCYATEGLDPEFLYDVAVFSKSVMLQSNAVFLKLKNLSADDQTLYDRLETLHQQANGASGNERARLEREADDVEVQLIQHINRDGSYARELNVTCAEVKKALKKGDAAVEFIRYRKPNESPAYAALVLHRGKVSFVPLFAQSDIEQYTLPTGKTLAQSIQSPKSRDKNALFTDPALASRIWQPVIGLLPTDCHVHFSAEGLLNTLGIEYMTDAWPRAQFSRLSSTRQLIGKSTKYKVQSTNKYKVQGTNKKTTAPLVVGGIDYNDASQSEPSTTLPDRSGSFTFALDKMLPTAGNKFGYLPGSRAEADSICKIVGRTSHYEGAAATEAVVKRAMQEHAQIHVSTHGVAYGVTSNVPTVDVSSPAFSTQSTPQDLSLSRCGIVLAGVNKTSAQTAENTVLEDGILTAREVCDLDLSHNQLTVLSACQTGLGNVAADGLVGLPQGLKRAGAGAVVVSLWPVDDKATQLLMQYFYEHLNSRKGITPEEALHYARHRLRTAEIPETKTIRWFDPGTLTNKVRTVETIRTFNEPYYYNAFIVFDGE